MSEIIQVEYKFMENNFVPSVLTIGGMGLALHYKELLTQIDAAPLIMAYGLPVSGKSLAKIVHRYGLDGRPDKHWRLLFHLR